MKLSLDKIYEKMSSVCSKQYGEDSMAVTSDLPADIKFIKKTQKFTGQFLWILLKNTTMVMPLRHCINPDQLTMQENWQFAEKYQIDLVNGIFQKVDAGESLVLLEGLPTVPFAASREEFVTECNACFEQFNFSSLLKGEDLAYSYNKAKQIGNMMIVGFISLLMDQEKLFLVRERLEEIVENDHETVDDLHRDARPLLKKLGFPEKWMNKSFKEIMIYSHQDLDYGIIKCLPKLVTKESFLKSEEKKPSKQENERHWKDEKTSGSNYFGKGLAMVAVVIIAVGGLISM